MRCRQPGNGARRERLRPHRRELLGSHFQHCHIPLARNPDTHGCTDRTRRRPITLAAVALLLQLDPHFDRRPNHKILPKTSRSDSFTGRTPNRNWGFGKLDMLAAADAVATLRDRNRDDDEHSALVEDEYSVLDEPEIDGRAKQ